MPWGAGPRVALVVVALLLSPARAGSRQGFDLGAPREIASGITLYHLTGPSLLNPPAKVSDALIVTHR